MIGFGLAGSVATNFLVGFCFLGLSVTGLLGFGLWVFSSCFISFWSCCISFSSFLSCWSRVCFCFGVFGVVIGCAFCLVDHVDACEVADGV